MAVTVVLRDVTPVAVEERVTDDDTVYVFVTDVLADVVELAQSVDDALEEGVTETVPE